MRLFLKILITNLFLDGYGGTESWCYAIATELKRRGHEVFVYTPLCGKLYEEFKKENILFTNSGNFDLILDNHQQSNLIKCTGFKIHTCHGITYHERFMPNVLNVAVSKKVAEKYNLNIIIPNGIDTNRFYCKNPVHSEIKKVLSLCKSDTANDVLKQICHDADVKFESMYGKEVFNIEDKINEADLVVGIGRSLLDAMSCGRPVVSFDDRIYYQTRMMGHGYLTSEKFKYQEIDNLTGNSLKKSFNKLELAKEIFEKYNPKDGEINRQYILDNLSVEKTVNKYLEVYTKNNSF